ncbi:hypothetical protein DL93DRAFT_2146915 [Clavulina sp. PMI_390]|nr:hypothetical protein DL93DRAFT_2146915 [Clavulina sp. PMI_390]
MIVIDIIRKGSVTSMIAIELGWLGFLWIMWLATAADTASNKTCSNSVVSYLGSLDSTISSLCSQFRAAEAFSFLTWLLLMGYWALLMIFSVMAHSSGNQNIWTTAVSDAGFTNGSGAATQPATTYPAVPGEKPMHEIPVSYPPPQNV